MFSIKVNFLLPFQGFSCIHTSDSVMSVGCNTEIWTIILRIRQDCISLVPRPSPAPVFDRLQYAKTEPEDLESVTSPVAGITW